MGFIEALKAIFGIDRVAESAMKIVDRIAGTDLTPKEKLDWVLAYQKETKHQSIPRRILAFMFAVMWMILCICWLVSTAANHYLDSQASLAFAVDIKNFMGAQLEQPMNLIIGFYFGIALIKR